jgi:hypothetical protein
MFDSIQQRLFPQRHALLIDLQRRLVRIEDKIDSLALDPRLVERLERMRADLKTSADKLSSAQQKAGG